MICLTDNDVILKLAICDLLAEFPAALNVSFTDILVLNSAIHKLLSPKKPGKGKVKPGEPEYERLQNFAGKHPQPSPRFLTGINAPPLRLDEHGDIYVGQSRVLLDTIVEEFNAGTPPPDIVRGYDTVAPADVYATIAYYLRYKDEVDAYLQRRDTAASALWNEIDSTQPSKADLKAQIKERWSSRKVTNASSAE